MALKEWFNNFKFRFKIFIWFLITEPFRQIKELGNIVIHIFEAFNKTLNWAYVGLIIMVVFLFLGKKNIAAMGLGFMLFIFLLWEWERGYFMERWRKHVKNKINKEVKKNG